MFDSLQYQRTPAADEFVRLWSDGDHQAVSQLVDGHWSELWYAFAPADFRRLIEGLPAEVAMGEGIRYLAELTGAGHVPPALLVDGTPTSRVMEASQDSARLRLAGRPVAALERFQEATSQLNRSDGSLLDSSQGLHAVGLIQTGIAHILAGDLSGARGMLLEAAGLPTSPVRFPFVQRDAAAKLALALAISGDPIRASSWLARAREIPRTASWVEELIDDTVWLTEYIVAIDALDCRAAEAMRLERPSPLSHLEFWGIALQAQVRHLVLTNRHEHARDLCDEVAAVGLPLEGSDGWLASMLIEARYLCLRPGWPLPSAGSGTGVELIVQRRQLLSAGQFELLAQRFDPQFPAYEGDGRVRLILDILRAQGVLGAGRVEEGRHLLLCALREIFGKGTLGVLRFVTDDALRSIGDHELGHRASRVVADALFARPTVKGFVQAPLTPAQLRVLRLVRDGYSRGQIAEALNLSVDTVKSHLRSAYRKLRVGNRSEACAKLTELGF